MHGDEAKDLSRLKSIVHFDGDYLDLVRASGDFTDPVVHAQSRVSEDHMIL